MGPEPSTPKVEELLVHGRFLRALARGLVSDPDRADDLVQDTWRIALERPPSHGAAPRGWLARILRRLAITRGQREGERARLEEDAGRERALTTERGAATQAAELDLARALLEKVARLREPYQSAIYLRYYRGLSPNEIAAELAEPVKTIKTRLARGLEFLRTELDREHRRRDAWVALLLPLARRAPLLPRESWPRPSLATTAWLSGLALVAAGTALVVSWFEGAEERAPATAPVADVPAVPPTPDSERTVAPSAQREAETPEPTRSERRDTRVHFLGRVVDERGEPLSGIEVAVELLPVRNTGLRRGLPLPEVPAEVVRGTSDASGAFALASEVAGLARIALDHDGRAPRRLVRRAHPGQTVELGTLVLEPGVVLAGLVRDADGRPIEGAELWREFAAEGLSFGGPEGERECIARTDRDGAFRITRQAAGEFEFEARAPGCAPAIRRGTTSTTDATRAELLFELARGESVRGRVLGLDAEAVESALVLARSVDGSRRGLVLQRAPLDAHGEFAFDTLPALEELELVVVSSLERRAPLSETVRARPGDAGVLLVAAATPPARAGSFDDPSPPTAGDSATLEIRVRRPSGEPAAGALVAYRRPARGSFASFEVRVASAQGRLRWEELSTGASEFCVLEEVLSVPAGPWRQLELVSGAALELELTAPERGLLSGTATCEGLALGGAKLRLRADSASASYTTRADARGRFRFPPLASGDYLLELEHPSRASASQRPVRVASGETEVRFELADVRLGGEVRTDTGAPVAGATVSLVTKPATTRWRGPREERAPRGAVVTDATGRFELAGLEGLESLALEIRAAGYATLRTELAHPQLPPVLTLAREALLELELETSAPFLVLEALGPRSERLTFGVTPGHNTLRGLGAGTWRLTLYAPRGPRGDSILAERTLELTPGTSTALPWDAR